MTPETDLQTIRTWPLENGWQELLEFVAERWQSDANWMQSGGKFSFHTNGWSGNEELITALQANEMFWLCCAQSWRRGGHWEFKVSGE